MPISFLDIAAGPATNAIAMNKLGIKAYAIDQSQTMVNYGIAKAQKMHAEIVYLQADMQHFSLPEPVDLAAIFMASTGYLLTNQNMLQHLRMVANNLKPNGIYVLEMLHPRDVLSSGKSTSTSWIDSDGDTKVSVQWGDENDSYDPITQVRMVTAHLKYTTPKDSGEIIERNEQREYTFQEMLALIELSDCFELKKALGSWDNSIPLSNDAAAWRMILALQKK
jgi:ubiquinone/menaquinone biosynthesis C-methylase UbiE